MRRLTMYVLAAFSTASFSLHAGNSVKSYPASLCYQSTGPENSLAISGLGDVSNTNFDSKITLFCPVIIEQNALSSLEVDVIVIDEGSQNSAVNCQLSGSSFTSLYTSKWGNSVSSESGQGLQTVTTRLSDLDVENSRYSKANLSCTLPPASDDGKVALISYQVTEY